MRKTNVQTVNETNITTDLSGLTKLLGCGEATARSIGRMAGARVETGGRRTLYSVEKIREYCAKKTY